MPSPIANITYHRRMLESALSKPGISPETLLSMSQQLDRLINHSMRVRSGHFACASLYAQRQRRINRGIP